MTAPRLLVLTALLGGVFACSTAALFIKTSAVHPAVLSAWRLLIAAAVLSPLFLRAWRRQPESLGWTDLRRSLIPGVLLALHFISWAAGARMTPVANATLIVNMVPVAMPFFLFFLLREKINRGEIAGTVLALAGVTVLAWSDYRFEPENLPGDAVCFASMLLFGLYLAYGRLNRGAASIWLYLVPLYAVAGVICLLLSLPFANPFAALPMEEIRWLVALALIPTVLGHSLLNFSLKHISGQSVSVCNLGQFIFAGSMAWLWFGEIPHGGFYPAALLVIAGAVTVALAMPPGGPTPVRVPSPGDR